eukprot:3304014-Rhodomonas_salina.2
MELWLAGTNMVYGSALGELRALSLPQPHALPGHVSFLQAQYNTHSTRHTAQQTGFDITQSPRTASLVQ